MQRKATRNGSLDTDDEPAPTPIQLVAVAALASGASMTEAAERAGVDRATLFRWRRDDPPFLAELNRTRMEARDRIQAEVRGLAAEAVATMRALMTDASAPPVLRLKIATKILKAVGGLDHVSPGPTGPADVAEELLKEEQIKDLLTRIG